MMGSQNARAQSDEPHERETVRSILDRTAKRLSAPELLSEGPMVEARELLAFALGVFPAQLDARLEARPSSDERARFDDLLRRRLGDEPTGYLVGAVELRGIRFKIDRRAFIARLDLPVLVDAALEGVPADLQGYAADLACGMGAAGILMGVLRPGLIVDLADLDAPAVDLAVENADRIIPGRGRGFAGDLFDALPADRRGEYDVIAANPPWVPDGTVLPDEVIKHEPTVSFFGGPDGLNIVRRLIAALPLWLKRGGRYAQECDPTQIEKVKALLAEAGFTEVKAHVDLEDVQRVVSGTLK